MVRQRIISILLSAMVFCAAGGAGVWALGKFFSPDLSSVEALLRQAAFRIESKLDDERLPVQDAAVALSEQSGLAADMRLLDSQMKQKQNAGRARKVDELRDTIRGHVKEVSKTHTFDSLAIVSSSGTVLYSGWSFLSVGTTLNDPSPHQKKGASATEAEMVVNTWKRAGSWITQSESGDMIRSAVIYNDVVHWVAVVPVMQRGRSVGVILGVAKMTEIPPVAGITQSIVWASGKTILGTAPARFAGPKLVNNQGPYVSVKLEPVTSVLNLFDIPMDPIMVSVGKRGLMAQRFAIPDLDDAEGLVFWNTAAPYNTLASVQVSVLLLAFLGWLVHVTMFAIFGRGLVHRLEDVADFVGRVFQGMNERPMEDRLFPWELRRLVRLVNKFLETRTQSSSVSPLSSAPSIDDVLDAQTVASDGDAELDFFSAAVSEETDTSGADLFSPDSNPSIDGDYQSVQDFVPEVKDDGAGHTSAELPAVGDALAAMDKMTEPTPAPAAPAFDASAPAAGSATAHLFAQGGAHSLDSSSPFEAPAAPAPSEGGGGAMDLGLDLGGPPASGAGGLDLGAPPATGGGGLDLGAPPAADDGLDLGGLPGGLDAAPALDLGAPPTDSGPALDLGAAAPAPAGGLDSLDLGAPPPLDGGLGGLDLGAAPGAAPAAAPDLSGGLDLGAPPQTPAVGGASAELNLDPDGALDLGFQPSAPAPQAAPAQAPAPAAAPSLDGAIQMSPEMSAALGATPPADQSPAGGLPTGVNPHYAQIFEQFVQTRQRCGESVESLTVEKFVGRLEKSRDAVMDKHNCRDVLFEVYVKNGKAALKATPSF